jgi:hypothetical protein
MNWNNNGERKKDCNNLAAVRHFDRLLALLHNPSQTLTWW